METGTLEFGTPMFGEMTVIEGVPGCTVNALERVTISVPVVTVTDRAPAAVPPAMVTGTDNVPGPFTVTVPGAMPLPKLTVVWPAVKWVNAPLIWTVRLAPCDAWFGVTDCSAGMPAATLKPFGKVATSVPVVM